MMINGMRSFTIYLFVNYEWERIFLNELNILLILTEYIACYIYVSLFYVTKLKVHNLLVIYHLQISGNVKYDVKFFYKKNYSMYNFEMFYYQALSGYLERDVRNLIVFGCDKLLWENQNCQEKVNRI